MVVFSLCFKILKLQCLVNKYISNFFPVKKHVRQGDPLSLYLFVVFIEPMFRSIMPNYLIDGVFTSGSNAFVIKYFVYTDDVTLMLLGLFSVSKAFDLLLEYEMATGSKINFKTSKKFFTAKIKDLLFLLMC